MQLTLRQVLRRPGNPDAILRSNLFKIGVRRDPLSRRPLAVVANGAGSGHGVGLCQTGAIGMAREGSDAREILEHYYRGADGQMMRADMHSQAYDYYIKDCQPVEPGSPVISRFRAA